MTLAALAEAWLLLFLLAAGLGLGAACALALGQLLRERWVAPMRPGLAALARGGLPLALLLALPMPLFTSALWPWGAGGAGWLSPGFVWGRSLVLLALWAALGHWLAATPPPEPGVAAHRWRGGATLLALLPTGALAMEDWALSRDAAWSGSVQGLALVAEQMAAALALAALVALAQRTSLSDRAARTGLERALLALGLGVLWLWFTQYLVVYAADIPAEAAWYLRREAAPWGMLKLFIALPALLGAIALALVPQWRDWRLALVATLLAAHHPVHLVWVVRPEASPGAASPVVDALALAVGAALLLLALRSAAAAPTCRVERREAGAAPRG